MKRFDRAMSKIRRFTQFSVRDLFATAGPTVLLIGALCVLAYLIVDPAPPRHVTLATGQENSAYEQFARQYAEQALAPILKDGRATAIEVSTERPGNGRMHLLIVVTAASGERLTFQHPVKVI